jgi:hypothetical protein
VYGYFEAGRFTACRRCGKSDLAPVPGMGLFEAEWRWFGPGCAVHGDESVYGIVALLWRSHPCSQTDATSAEVSTAARSPMHGRELAPRLASPIAS